VPGDILLDSVCSRFKVRYKKDIDGQRLAGLITANEIDKEMKSIIADIVKPDAGRP
jgi:hypothetical protein